MIFSQKLLRIHFLLLFIDIFNVFLYQNKYLTFSIYSYTKVSICDIFNHSYAKISIWTKKTHMTSTYLLKNCFTFIQNCSINIILCPGIDFEITFTSYGFISSSLQMAELFYLSRNFKGQFYLMSSCIRKERWLNEQHLFLLKKKQINIRNRELH